MKDATVVRALVAARAVFFFKNADRRLRLTEQQLAGDSQSHDPSADNEMVVLFQNGKTIFHSGSTRSS